MCGIAGILYKACREAREVGQSLIQMLEGCQHRGRDSTGFALYEEAKEGQLRLRFLVGQDQSATEAIARIKEILAEHDANIVNDETIGNNYRVTVEYHGDIQKLAYAAEQLSRKVGLNQALENCIASLDGTFSFLVSTKDAIGYAKDHLAVKPMVMYEDDDLVAIASEEVSLNRLFPGRSIETTEPLPGTFRTWSKSI